MKTAFIKIIRVKSDEEHGTFGVLKINETWMCVTLELPDRLNKKATSSIPTGQYWVKKFKSPKYGWTWRITGVTGRSYILFHAGNLVKHSKGCVIVAEHFGKLGKDYAVLNSGKTFKSFLAYMDDYELGHLTVSEHF